MIVDDEPQMRKLLKISLEGEGYKTVDASNAAEAMRLSVSVRPDLIILDLGLPDLDGKEVITKVREWTQTPIIVCSVRDSDKEIIESLNQGADDYITKPFNPNILLARIQANLRKSATAEAGNPVLENGRIKMDLIRHEVFIEGKSTFFTPKEYDLLRYFMVNRGKMITHKQLLKDVWGPAHGESMQYLRVYVSQLREKIEPNVSELTYIVTEPGIGYRMEVIDPIPCSAEDTVTSQNKTALLA